jgi:type IV pilus assembly protein PilQ|tara:strand:- start:4618 stop:6444 length:1827 start_codon:yes stop_codon:yes gene_type:complete
MLLAVLFLAGPVHAQDAEPASEPESDIEMTSYGTVDMAVQDADLVQVLEMLSMQSQRNIIAGRDVSATVTANLYDVTFEEALDSILRVNGYGFIEEGAFIYVYPLERIAEIEKARRQVETRIFELYYLNASDAAQVIQPLLSDAGQAVPMGTVEEGFNPDESDNGADAYAYTAKIVVTDYPSQLERIAELLVDLDLSPQQVMVESTILQTKVSENNAFGIDFSLVSHLNFEDIVSPLSAANDLISGNYNTDNALAGTSTVGGTDTGAGGFKFGVVKDDFAIFLRALDSVTDVTVVARPKVMCLNRQRGEILVGRRLGYLNTTQTETSTTQTVEFLDTGIHLMFRPFITPNEMIRMELYPRLSSGDVQLEANYTVPNEDTHEIFTNVRVKSGETIVLGGLFEEQTTMSREQVPLLGDIPIVGNAFRGQDDETQRKEIIFLVTPSIIADERLWEMGQDGLEILDAVRLGARAGLLPFSRDQITADYNRDAIEAFRKGELDLALYYANNSLRTSSKQPEMARMRDTLSSNKQEAWNRNMQRRILDREIDLVPPNDLTPAPVAPEFDPEQPVEPAEAPVSTSDASDLPILETDTDGDSFGASTDDVTRAAAE